MKMAHTSLKLEPLTINGELLVFKVKNTVDELIRLGFLGTEAYIQLFRVNRNIAIRVSDAKHQIMWSARRGVDVTINSTANNYLLKVILDTVKKPAKKDMIFVNGFIGDIF